VDLSSLPGRGGVYALVDAEGRLIQLAGTEGLRRAIAFRLAPPDGAQKRKRADLRAVTRRIFWQPTFSPFETSLQFHRISRRLAPKQYRTMCAFGPAWFVHVNPDEPFARFVATTEVSSGPGVVIGPFPTRASCTRFIEILQDVFELCRHHAILMQAPHGTPCAYFEMGRCPAPCSGRITPAQYHQKVLEAVRFAAGERENYLRRWRDRMRQASADLQFEQAAAYKQKIERAAKVTAGLYRFARDIRRFCYLIVQRGPGRTHVKPFFVRQGWIESGQSVAFKQLPQVAPAWLARMSAPPPPTETLDATIRTEQIWLVAHYLFKQEKAPGLFLHRSELPDADGLTSLILRTFGPRPRKPAGPSGRRADGTDVNPTR